MATPAETSENATVGSCIIEATVPTGFEMIAAEEAKEVFNTECRSLRGKIQFETPISRVKEIVELGGIDHCRAQILHVPCFGFTSDGDECLARLCKLVKDGNWTEGLKIWSMFHSFDHHISPEPKQEMTAEELVDIVYSVYMPGNRRKPHPRDDEKNGTDKKKGGGGKRDKKRGKDKRREKKEDENKPEAATENSTQESATENSVEDASTENSTQDADDVEKKTDGENEGGAENGEEEKEQGLCEGKDVQVTAPSQENRIEENGGEVATGAGGVTEAGDCASVLPVLPSAPVPTEAGDASTVDPALGTTMTQLASCTQDIPESGDAPAASEKSPPSIHISPPSSPTKNDSGSEVDAAGLDAAKEESAPECQQSEPQDLGMVNGADSSVDPAVVASGDAAQDEMAAAGSEDEKLQTKPESEQEETAEKSEAETSAPPAKKRRDFDPTKPTFRITCKRNGDHHSFDSMSAAASFGSAVQRYFGWNVDMTNFNIEIVLNIDNNDVSFGLALTPESLHRRNVVAFGVTTLRPTICHNMLRMVKVRPGHVVCDPLCGTGSISIQGAQKFPALQLCGDNSRIAMEKTFINMDAMNKKRSAEGKGCLMMDAVKWNACHMPLRDGIVDVFVTDLPFGKRLGKKFNNTKLYRNVLDEMARVSKDGGRAALLTGDIHNMHKAIQQQKYWSRRRVYSCSIGGISACVFLLFRDKVPYVKYVRDSWRPRREPDATVADGAGPADKHVDSEVKPI